MLKIGHRGAMGYEPENTLLSFQRALDLKVDAVELDVHRCQTGELVIIHDDKVNRTTNGKGYVAEKTFDELRLLDAGKGQKIPTLEEVLDLVDKKAIVNIELKGTGTAEPVSKIIRKYIQKKGWQLNFFLVSSFNYYELQKFHQFAPEISIGILISEVPLENVEFTGKADVSSVHVCAKVIDRKFIEDAHQRGMKVFVWTVNHPQEIKRVKTLGVDGIFSDFPDLF